MLIGRRRDRMIQELILGYQLLFRHEKGGVNGSNNGENGYIPPQNGDNGQNGSNGNGPTQVGPEPVCLDYRPWLEANGLPGNGQNYAQWIAYLTANGCIGE